MKYDFENINTRYHIGSQKWQELKNNPAVRKSKDEIIPFSY